jgi:hypothetical protein
MLFGTASANNHQKTDGKIFSTAIMHAVDYGKKNITCSNSEKKDQEISNKTIRRLKVLRNIKKIYLPENA